MLKRGIIIVAVILLIALLTYFNPSITSLGFLSFNKEKDEIVYAADILNVNILNAQIISQNEIKVLIENKESIKLRLFIKVEGDKGIDSYYDTGLLEAKSTKYLTITFNKDKTGNFIKKINIIPYLQLENKKIVYKFSETSIQINKQISAEEISQETSLDSQILTTSQQRESTYIYGNGLIASLDDQGNIQYYHKDNLGSIRAITDSNGDIIYATSYEPFGTKFAETGSSSYTYTGKQQDNTGLYYYGARYYDANLGRFTQLDPILSADDSPYVYVSNNPLKFVDPTGEEHTETFNSENSNNKGRTTLGVNQKLKSPKIPDFARDILNKDHNQLNSNTDSNQNKQDSSFSISSPKRNIPLGILKIISATTTGVIIIREKGINQRYSLKPFQPIHFEYRITEQGHYGAHFYEHLVLTMVSRSILEDFGVSTEKSRKYSNILSLVVNLGTELYQNQEVDAHGKNQAIDFTDIGVGLAGNYLGNFLYNHLISDDKKD